MSSLLESPGLFNQFLENEGLLSEGLYDALSREDMADIVMEAKDILVASNTMPALVKCIKDKTNSAELRKHGNKHFKEGKYQYAMTYYNMALLAAPDESEEMVLAYGNRSAVFLDCKMYQACINDVDICLALKCPKNILEKLKKRRADAMNCLFIEKVGKDMRYSKYVDDFFKIKKRNPQIPCASADIGVIRKSAIPQVVAIKDIGVGTVLADEAAFVASNDRALLACHHCQKMSLNLIPCDTCRSALYCSKACLGIADHEYHVAECIIIELFENKVLYNNVAVKAALKIKYKFATWDKFIEATAKLGLERIEDSDINEIFDGDNVCSMLNMRDDKPYLHGQMFNYAWGCAVVVHYLGYMRMFFPAAEGARKAAMRAFGRLMLFLSLHVDITMTAAAVVVLRQQKTSLNEPCLGVYPFIGKLRRECNPNALVVGLNNRAALVAIRPIRPGEELTVTLLSHWLESTAPLSLRRSNMLTLLSRACDCPVCEGQVQALRVTSRLSQEQIRCVRELTRLSERFLAFRTPALQDIFPKCCNALGALADQPFSKEYEEAFVLFRRCLLDIQDFHSENYLLSSGP